MAVMDDTNELEARAGKTREDAHPAMDGDEADPDPSDFSDPRVAQPGEDPAGEDALHPPEDADRR